MTATSKTQLNLDDSRLYINRELSWLSFNERVLEMARREDVPPMERMKFLAIFSSNLDEFFMIRVAGLMQRVQAGIQTKDPSGLTADEQLEAVRQKTLTLTARHAETAKTLLALLQKHGLYILNRKTWNSDQRRFIRDYFQSHLLPLLTPIAVTDPQSFPLLPNLQLHIGITLSAQAGEEKQLMVIPVPTIVPRFIGLPSREGEFWVTLEDILMECAGRVVQGKSIESVDVFRITRDADVKSRKKKPGICWKPSRQRFWNVVIDRPSVWNCLRIVLRRCKTGFLLSFRSVRSKFIPSQEYRTCDACGKLVDGGG
jgi:polyphosphate kinase